MPPLGADLAGADQLWGVKFGWCRYRQMRLPPTALASGVRWGIWHYHAGPAGIIPDA